MNSIDIAGVNWIAAIAAAGATFFLGGLWYTALFGKRWRELQGITDAQVAELQKRRPPPLFFGGMLASYLVLSLAIALLFQAAGVTSAARGALAGLLLWIGPAAAIRMTDHLSGDRPIGVLAIDSSFQLIYLVGIGAILGGWQ